MEIIVVPFQRHLVSAHTFKQSHLRREGVSESRVAELALMSRMDFLIPESSSAAIIKSFNFSNLMIKFIIISPFWDSRRLTLSLTHVFRLAGRRDEWMMLAIILDFVKLRFALMASIVHSHSVLLHFQDQAMTVGLQHMISARTARCRSHEIT